MSPAHTDAGLPLTSCVLASPGPALSPPLTEGRICWVDDFYTQRVTLVSGLVRIDPPPPLAGAEHSFLHTSGMSPSSSLSPVLLPRGEV